MKACSFVPAATRMIYDMGLEDLLHGVTFECPQEAAAKPAVVRCLLEGHSYSSEEIDRIFSASKAQGKSLYYVDETLLQDRSRCHLHPGRLRRLPDRYHLYSGSRVEAAQTAGADPADPG